MNLKKMIFIFLLFNNFTFVNAETLEEKLSSLSTKVDELMSQDDITLDNLYPVGSIYISSSSTSPEILFGGSWEVYAADKQLIGNGSNGTTTYSAGATGGSVNKTLALANMTYHSHSLTAVGTVTSTFTGSKVTSSSSGGHTHTVAFYTTENEASAYGMSKATSYQNRVMVYDASLTTTTTSKSFSASTHSVTPVGTVSSTFVGSTVTSSSVGSGESFSVQNPYVTVYMWKRID